MREKGWKETGPKAHSKNSASVHTQNDWTTGVLDNSLMGGGNRGVLDYRGRAGIISIVRRNLRPVTFGVDSGVDSAAL